MWKKMNLTLKLGMGFCVVVIITVLLGMMSLINMKNVQQATYIVANENVPEVVVANNVERWSLKTVYEMRGYAYTEDEQFLDKMRQNLSQVKKYLADAKMRGAASSRLEKLKEAAQEAETATTEYEKLVDETKETTTQLEKYRQFAEKLAKDYMEECNLYLEDESGKMRKNLKEDVDPAKIAEYQKILTHRSFKIEHINNLINIGNQVLIGTWKSQFRRDPALVAETRKRLDEIPKVVDEILPMTTQQYNVDQLEHIRTYAKQYGEQLDSFLKIWLKREDLDRKRNEITDRVLDLAESTAQTGMEDTSKASLNAASTLAGAMSVMIFGLIIGTILAIILALLISTGISKAIMKIVTALNDGSEQTASAAQQVASSSQELSQGATSQASSLEETSSALDEMASMIKQNADNAAKASQMATETKLQAEKGDVSMKDMQSSMKMIGESSDKVGKIIKTIEEIAFQTNILALNAAVEAARAGEHGKGFAVVADEVRNLAQRAALAAKDTQSLIENSQTRTKEGAEITQKASEALKLIMEAAKKVADVVNEIALASKEQAEGINQVTNAVSQMDQVTQQNAASAEESAAASEQLSGQAENIKEMVLSLQQIVSGNGITSRQIERRLALKKFKRHHAIDELSSRRQQNLGNNGHKQIGAGKDGPKVLKPEDIIPFDDKEGFKDF